MNMPVSHPLSLMLSLEDIANLNEWAEHWYSSGWHLWFFLRLVRRNFDRLQVVKAQIYNCQKWNWSVRCPAAIPCPRLPALMNHLTNVEQQDVLIEKVVYVKSFSVASFLLQDIIYPEGGRGFRSGERTCLHHFRTRRIMQLSTPIIIKVST